MQDLLGSDYIQHVSPMYIDLCGFNYIFVLMQEAAFTNILFIMHGFVIGGHGLGIHTHRFVCFFLC